MFNRLKELRDSLARTRNQTFGQILDVLGQSEVTPELWDDLEALLIQADLGVETTEELIGRLRERAGAEGIVRAGGLQGALKQELRALLGQPPPLNIDPRKRRLHIILIVGVNGSGKTTSIGKLANYYRLAGRRVLLAAADTFRAAAIEQLQVWGERAQVPVIAGRPGGDPGAVVYDAVNAANARDTDLIIVDTAGRLHVKFNLMQELKKIHGVAAKSVHEAPHETLLVLDATTGQNAIAQAASFQEAAQVSGVILAKLDGTAKGGVVFAIARERQLPVRFVGTGERIDDLAPFDPDAFVDGLFEP
jgi:fused signal recognition particle receptor